MPPPPPMTAHRARSNQPRPTPPRPSPRLTPQEWRRQVHLAERRRGRRQAKKEARAAQQAALEAGAAVAEAREKAQAADAQATRAYVQQRAREAETTASSGLLLEEYDASNFTWARHVLIHARSARTQRLDELEATASVPGLMTDAEKDALALLRRNETIDDALRRLSDLAPDVDGNARRGQYMSYRHGSLDCPGWGRHYARGCYTDATSGKQRSADLQGCPRELRRLLAAPFCHDLDFVNSLPTVASQLDALGLCPARHLALLGDYCANREAWFADITAWHNIPPQVDATTTAKDVAKALPIRLLHGGTYAKWVKDFVRTLGCATRASQTARATRRSRCCRSSSRARTRPPYAPCARATLGGRMS